MRSFAGIVFFALFPYLLFSQKDKPSISKQPSWITILNIDYSNNKLDKEAEDGYIDMDYENQVNLNDQSVYIRRSTKILSNAGVQSNSQVTVNFDPAYQQLVFHSIEIIRSGESINKLDLKKIKIIHSEKELDMFIYNGELQAVLILDDVRKGDVIQLSYTLKGFNPVFKNKYHDEFDTRLGFPVCNFFYKVIVPANRKINIKNNNDTVKPAVHVENTNTVYEWYLKDIPALHAEDQLPDWYYPYSSIMVSEFNSWAEVNDWARQLFPLIINLPEGLKDKINKINTTYKTKEQKTSAALEFVQDDIRYMGIEIGENSHKPADPAKVFNQRFGDCKEKSYLLCVMLKSMDIDASPVLINTSYKKAITEWLPAPTDFNHCTVRTKINNKIYWLDPTISYQRGALDDISYPDYQYGLVVFDSVKALTPIKPQGKNEQTVKEIFTVPGFYGLCYLKVITTYSGYYADDIRDNFNYNSEYEMQKSFLDFYKSYFDNIKADSLTYFDNDSTGIFTTTEYYSIDSFWSVKKGARTANFSCYVVSTLFKKPKDIHRKMPVGLIYPVHVNEELDINLPDNKWNLEEVNQDVRCTSFSFSKKSTVYSDRMIINYDYERFKDNIMPDETGEYLSSLEKINKEQDYKLTWGDKERESSSGNLIGVIVLMLVIVGLIIWRTQKRR